MALGMSRFERILAANILKGEQRDETERYKADVGAAAKIKTAKVGRASSGMTTEWGPAPGGGEMERAKLTAAVQREGIAARAATGAEAARIGRGELGLARESAEFQKAFLKKKKKKRDAGISLVEEIEEIAASPRY